MDSIEWYNNYNREQPSTSKEVHCRPPEELCKSEKIDTDGRIEIDQSLTSKEIPKKTCVTSVKEDPGSDDVICLIDEDEEAVERYHEEAKQALHYLLSLESENENKFIDVIEKYKETLESQVELLSGKYLKEVIIKDLMFITINYQRIAVAYIEKYLDIMEEILVYFCDVIRNYFKDQKKFKLKIVIKMESRKIKILLRDCLLNRFDRIMHVLMRVKIAMEMQEHRILWTDIYRYYLARVFKYRHHDDILRGFIIFQRLKEIRPKEEAEKIELFMLKTYRKTKNELRKIPVLREILDKMENDPLYSVRDMCVHYNRYYKRKNEDMFLEVDNQQSPCEVKSFSKTWRMNFDVTRLVLPTLYSSQSCFGHVLSERKQGERKSVLELAGFFSSNDHLRSFDNELFHLDDGKQRKSKSIKKEPGSKNSSVIVVDDESDEDDIVLVSDDLENIAISNEASKAQPPKGLLVPTIQVPIEESPGNKNVEDSMQLTESLSQVSALPETVSLPSKELMPQTQEPTMVPNQITSIEETMPQIELVDKNMPKMLPICLRSSSETPGESLSLDEPTLTEESQEIASNYMKSLPPKTGLPPNLPEEIDKPLEPVEKQNPTNRNILVSNNQGLTYGKSIISFEDEINKEKEKSASYCETSKDLLTSSDSVSLVKYNSASKLISVNGDVQVSSKICESEIADNLGSNKKVNSLSEKLSSEKIEKTTSEKVLSQFPSNQETEKLESKKDILQHPEETTETASSENKDLNLLQRENHLVKEISSSLPLENLPSITADGLLKEKPSSAVNSNTAAERVLTSSILEQHEENSQKTREDCCKLITGNDGLSQRSLKEEDISSKINGESTSKITETVSTDNSQATNENEPNSPHYEALDEKEVQIYFSARKNEINPELEGRVTPLVINESTSASLPKENLNEENKTIQPNIAQNTLDCTSISVEEKSNIDVTLQIEPDSNILDIKPNETQNVLYDNASKIQNYPNITEFYTNFADEVSLDDNKSIDNLCADQDLSFALSEKTFVQTIELLSGEELTVSANESLVLSDDTITIRVATINAAKEEDIPLEYSEGQIAPYLGNTAELNNRDSSNNEILSPVENVECNKKAKDEELAQLNEALLPLHPDAQSIRRGAIDCQLPLSGSQPYTPQTSPNSRVDMVVPEASSILLSDTKDNDNIGAEKIFETASSEETINSATSLQNLFPMETNSFKVKLSLGRCGNVLENILNSSKKNQSIKRSISSEDCTIAHKPIKRYKETDKPFVEDLPQSLAITNSENSQPVKSTEEKCRLSEVKKSVHLESDKIVPLKHSEEYLVEYSQQKTDASQQNDYVVDYSNEKFPENIKKRGTKERVEESSQYLRIKGATQLPYSQENSILDTASKQNKTRNRCEPKEVFHKVSHSSLEYPSQMVPLSFTSGYMSQQSTNELPQEKSDEDLISYDSNELFNNGIEGPLDKPLRYSKNPMDNWSWWNDDTGSGSFMDEIRSSREIPIVTENQLGQNKKPQPENLVSCLKSSKEKIGNKSSTSRKTEAKKKVTFEDETVENQYPYAYEKGARYFNYSFKKRFFTTPNDLNVPLQTNLISPELTNLYSNLPFYNSNDHYFTNETLQNHSNLFLPQENLQIDSNLHSENSTSESVNLKNENFNGIKKTINNNSSVMDQDISFMPPHNEELCVLSAPNILENDGLDLTNHSILEKRDNLNLKNDKISILDHSTSVLLKDSLFIDQTIENTENTATSGLNLVQNDNIYYHQNIDTLTHLTGTKSVGVDQVKGNKQHLLDEGNKMFETPLNKNIYPEENINVEGASRGHISESNTKPYLEQQIESSTYRDQKDLYLKTISHIAASTSVNYPQSKQIYATPITSQSHNMYYTSTASQITSPHLLQAQSSSFTSQTATVAQPFVASTTSLSNKTPNKIYYEENKPLQPPKPEETSILQTQLPLKKRKLTEDEELALYIANFNDEKKLEDSITFPGKHQMSLADFPKIKTLAARKLYPDGAYSEQPYYEYPEDYNQFSDFTDYGNKRSIMNVYINGVRECSANYPLCLMIGTVHTCMNNSNQSSALPENNQYNDTNSQVCQPAEVPQIYEPNLLVQNTHNVQKILDQDMPTRPVSDISHVRPKRNRKSGSSGDNPPAKRGRGRPRKNVN